MVVDLTPKSQGGGPPIVDRSVLLIRYIRSYPAYNWRSAPPNLSWLCATLRWQV